jgi:hypothetical protein
MRIRPGFHFCMGMKNSDVKAGRRRRPQPRSFWSGAAPIEKLSDERGEVASAVALLPRTCSPPEDIVQSLLDLGARYHRYLHQDEYGPARADRGAALVSFKKALDTLARRLSKFPPDLEQLLVSRLSEATRSPDAPLADEFTSYEQERESVERIRDAASSQMDPNHTSIRRDRALFDKLRAAAEKALGLFEALDTTSEIDVVLAPKSFNQIRPSPSAGDVYTVVRGRLARLQSRVDLTLRALNRQRGPDRRLSLPWLVEQLGDLWSDETGEIVTSNAAKGGDYSGVPQSVAGQFITATVEALQPSKAWLAEHEAIAATASTAILNGPSGLRARAVNSILADYVARHPSLKRRGRRKKAVQTI